MIEDKHPFLLDSNIIIYAYDSDEHSKQYKAQKLLKECWDRKIRYAISTQNLSEFFVIITKKVKNPLSIDETNQIIQDIIHFSYFLKLIITPAIVLRAIGINKKTKCPYYDSLIAATMIENGIFNIYTENTKDFSKIEGITAVNPFL